MRFFQKIKEAEGWIRKKGEEHRAKEPERRAASISKAEHRLELQQIRQKTQESRTAEGLGRVKLQEARRKVMPAMPGGAGPFGPSAFQRPAAAPLAAPTPPKRRTKRRRKKKR